MNIMPHASLQTKTPKCGKWMRCVHIWWHCKNCDVEIMMNFTLHLHICYNVYILAESCQFLSPKQPKYWIMKCVPADARVVEFMCAKEKICVEFQLEQYGFPLNFHSIMNCQPAIHSCRWNDVLEMDLIRFMSKLLGYVARTIKLIYEIKPD